MEKKTSNKANQTPSVDEYLGKDTNKKSETNNPRIPWTHLFYKLYFSFRRLFCSPDKLTKSENLDLIEQVQIVLQSGDSSDSETMKKCGQFLELNLLLENTAARKRLEKWAKFVISIYLLVVLFILLLHGGILTDLACLLGKNDLKFNFKLETTIVVALLTTTTVNVIGLGLIILRGHFPSSTKGMLKVKETVTEDK